MPNARHYRDELYRLRAHPHRNYPNSQLGRTGDERDSFSKVYLSVIPFAMVEYLVEAKFTNAISGLAFPTGYLLFWAFYYSFYRPGYLENKLSERAKLSNLPVVLMGAAIWLVKASVVEICALVVTGKRVSHLRSQPRAQPHASSARSTHYQKQEARSGSAYRPNPNPFSGTTRPRPATPPPARPQVVTLPSDVITALAALGLKETRSWDEIHRRYRELAKRFHPDLNPDITSIGNRFMAIDAAYRKLSGVKARYFQEKR